MPQNQPVYDLTEEQARAELARLADALGKANIDYHGEDLPTVDDAVFDGWKRRNQEIEALFPALKRVDSPSDQVGARPKDGLARSGTASECCHWAMPLVLTTCKSLWRG